LTPPIGFAHRGARAHAPENTLEAFSLALRLGATGLFSEVWMTADGTAVLDRQGTVGGRMRRRRLGDVERQELGGRVVTLVELFSVCGTDFHLALDVGDPAAALEAIAVARDVGVEERLWLCHHDWELVSSWRELSSQFKLVHTARPAMLDGGPERHVARLSAAGVDGLQLHHAEWSGGLTTLVHRFELYALAWDAQFERVLDEVLDQGVDGVIGDHVDRLADALRRCS
jgi:glycerophosphoryl diester phosphodiesterase